MNQCIHNIDLLRWLMASSAGSNGSNVAASSVSSNAAASASTSATDIRATSATDATDIHTVGTEGRTPQNAQLTQLTQEARQKAAGQNINTLCTASTASSKPARDRDVEEVFAYTDQLIHPYLEAEDLGLALVRFTNGSYGLIEGTTNIYPRNLEETLYLFGERGTVKAGGTSDNIIETWSFSDHYGPASDRIDDPETVKSLFSENPPNIYGFGHTPLYANVVAAIEGKERLLVTGEEGKKALELVLAIYKSAAEHRPVKLPLDESVSTLDFIGRFDKK